MDDDSKKALLVLLFIFLLGLAGGIGIGRSTTTDEARREGARTCQRGQPGYVRQSVSACIQEVQQKALRCQELAGELR